MTRWAACSPSVRKQTQLVLAALGAAMIALSCSGGGGGGGITPPGPQDCGSAAGSNTTVICGYVLTADAQRAPVANAAVTLKTAGAVTLVTTNTTAAGFYIFNSVPGSAALFQVDPPSPQFHPNLASYQAGLYYYLSQNNAATGPCIMALPLPLPAGDKKLDNVGVYPSAAPPPPPFGCPR